MELLKKFIIKETEKAILVEARFVNYNLEQEISRKIWIPKSCIEFAEKGFSIKSWFLKNKIHEIYGNNIAESTEFTGLKIQKEVA